MEALQFVSIVLIPVVGVWLFAEVRGGVLLRVTAGFLMLSFFVAIAVVVGIGESVNRTVEWTTAIDNTFASLEQISDQGDNERLAETVRRLSTKLGPTYESSAKAFAANAQKIIADVTEHRSEPAHRDQPEQSIPTTLP